MTKGNLVLYSATLNLNTHKVVKLLQDRGFTEPQAEGFIEAMEEITLSGVATKQDIEHVYGEIHKVRSEMQHIRAELKEDIQDVRHEVQDVRVKLKEDIQNVRTELKDDINKLDNKIDVSTDTMKVWMLTCCITQIFAIASLMIAMLSYLK